MEKILNILNIKLDKNQRWIILSSFISGLLITYAQPTIVKTLYSELPAQWIAFQSMFSSVAGFLIGVVWKNKLREKAINWFFWLASAESSLGFILGMYLCFVNFNVWIFAIASLIYSTLISTFVCKCIMAFKSVLWVEKEREIYDNNLSIVEGVVCIIGYSLSFLFLPPLKVSLFLWGLCCIIDDIGWIIVYYNNKNILIKKE